MRPLSHLALLSLAVIVARPQTSAAPVVHLLAGGGAGAETLTVDAALPAVRASLKEPYGAAFDGAGNLFIVEMSQGNRILKMDTKGMLRHVAGNGSTGDAGDGGPALKASFNGPHALAALRGGILLVADTWNGRVRRIDLAADVVSSLPGYGVPRERARASGPYCIAVDPQGSLVYVADLRRVHAIDPATGISRVVAGNGVKGVPRDGSPATEAPLVDPRAAAADGEGNLYILERGGHALRVVGRDGRIRTVVNASGRKGADGDGGAALSATLNGPKHLCVDLDGSVLIADAENHLIRRYVPSTGKIVRVAGTGKKGSAGVGGPPERCELNRPHGVAIAPDGAIIIVDSYNNRLLKIAK